MINRVLKTIQKHNMLSLGDRVVVGVSGGADSMALLHILIELREKLGISLTVAHIEHGIRGEESVADAKFVKSFCEARDIEFHLLSIDAVSEAKEADLGVEEYSRNVRYSFFNSLNPDKIATAHNLNDNAETLLFRLLRGTGLKGACGIPAVRGNIIRPLIDIPSQDVRDYCKQNGINYRVDSTNLESEYSRNFIRNELFPRLEAVNPDCLISLCSFISDANEDYDFIDYTAGCVYDSCIDDGKLITEELRRLHTAVAKRVVARYFYERELPLDRRHLEAVMTLLDKSSRTQIKNNFYAVSDKKYLRAAQFNNNEKCDFVSEILKISEFDSKTVDFYCDYDKINGDIVIRKRTAGDTIRPVGRNCTKSLKKLFNELSVPLEQREGEIVACDSLGVIGVIGYCVDERVRLDNNTVNVYTLKIPMED